MCKDSWRMCGFFEKVLFLEKEKVRIFCKNAILQKLKTTNYAKNSKHAYLKSFCQKRKSPDFFKQTTVKIEFVKIRKFILIIIFAIYPQN